MSRSRFSRLFRELTPPGRDGAGQRQEGNEGQCCWSCKVGRKRAQSGRDCLSCSKEGLLADTSTRLMVEALTRAASEPNGLPLFAVRDRVGLFPRRAVGEAAARRCQEEGLLSVIDGKHAVITDRGRQWLAEWSDPRQVIEDFLRIVERQQGQLTELVGAARHMAGALEGLRRAVEHWSAESAIGRERHHLGPKSERVEEDRVGSEELLAVLDHWPEQAAHDCSLPELYRRLKEDLPSLSIGQFHDLLRSLHESGQIYLHPWTGPLYELPEPSLALLVGHLIAYYASRRPAPLLNPANDRGLVANLTGKPGRG